MSILRPNFAARLLPAALLVGLFGQACVVTPTNDTVLGNPHATFTVTGFGNAGSAPIVVEAKNKKTGAWEQIASTTTAANAIITGDTFPGTNTPNLYYYTIRNVAVSTSTNRTTWCRWSSTCAINPGSVTAEIRVRQVTNTDTLQLYVGEDDSQECVQARLDNGEDFYGSSYECGYDTTVLYLRAIT